MTSSIAQKPLDRANGRWLRDGFWNAATGVRRRWPLWHDIPIQSSRMPRFRQWVELGRTWKVVLTCVVVEFFRIAVSSVLRYGWYCYKFGLFRRVIDAIFPCARPAMEEEERNFRLSCKQRTYALAVTVVLLLSTITCCECRKFL